MKNAFGISVVGSMKPILKDLDRVQRQCVPAATVAALNKTAKHVQTQAKKEIASLIGVPQKTIAKKLPIAKAKRSRLDAVVYFKHTPINPWLVSAARARRMAREAGGWALKPGHVSHPYVRRGSRHGSDWVRQGGNDRGGNTFPKGLVLRRKGAERYPTEAVGIAMDGAFAVILRHVYGSEPFFSRTFEHELQFRIDRRLGGE